MQDPNISEGIFARGWRDTKLAMQSIWFWLLDAGGGAVMGFFDPIWGVAWLGGGFVMLWLGATAGAPFKQRTEARNRLVVMLEGEPEWLPIEGASRYLRDLLEKEGADEAAAMIDARKGEISSRNPLIASSIGYFKQGINHGLIEARGRLTNGSEMFEICAPVEGTRRIQDILDDRPDEGFESKSKIYVDIEIRKSTIPALVDALKGEESDQLKASPEGRH